MNSYKEVAFRNYDASTNFYYNETVNANVWDGDFIMTSGYWVIDETYSYGDSTGQGDAETHQIIIQGDVKVIIEDDCALTLRYNNDYKIDAESLTQAITDTVSGAAQVICDVTSGDKTTKKSVKEGKKEKTEETTEGTPGVDGEAVSSLVQGIGDIIQSISSANEGTEVAMISVNSGSSFSLFGQEESSGILDIVGTVANSATDRKNGGAALGSDGGENSGIITINGCKVTARSYTNAAAIGGGSDGGCSNTITINGGEVTASVEDSGHGKLGAAIGGGGGADKSDNIGAARGIVINGGHVNATGCKKGAGIGGGHCGQFSNITINGGYIWTQGGEKAPGIGTGSYCEPGSKGITINNGMVHSVGGDYDENTQGGAGIGTGYDCDGKKEKDEDGNKYKVYGVSDIYINGGNIYAHAGEAKYSSAIGRGGCVTTSYCVSDIYINTHMTVKADGSVVSNHGQDLTDALEEKKTVTCTIGHLTSDDIQNDYYEIKEGKSDVGFFADTLDSKYKITGHTGGGYIYLTDNISLINSGKIEFSNIYVNGDVAHGGVIASEEEGGIIDLVDVDFTDNKVIHNKEEAAGGAIYSNGIYETTIARSSFTNNMASGYRLRSFGGAIAVEGEAMLTVKDTVFKDNKATSEGGAVWNNHNFIITGSDFINNYADKGGAVYVTSESLTDTKKIVDSTFAYNTANFGGAVFVDIGSTVSIENSDFTYNNAHTYGYEIESETIDFGEHQGGAVYVDGNKDARNGGTAVISNTDFTGNYAKQGAGLFVDSYANVAVSYADFVDNFAEDEGGAIYVAQYGTLALNNVYFSGNMSYIAGTREREKEVTVTTTSSDDDETTESSVTRYGTYKEEVILTKYCAVYNEGEINITGFVEVDPFCLDVLYNRGRVNWDMNGVSANGFFSDITLFSNEVTSGSYIGSFGITVNDNDIEGVSRYVLAEHAVFDDMTEETAMTLKRFVLRGVDGELDKVIIADGNTVEYNGKTYRLYTTDAEHYNQLILSVEPGKTERNSHIVVDLEHFNGAVLNSSGEFTGFNYGSLQGGAVLLTAGSVFSAHDSTFSGNSADAGGAIYTVSGSTTNLTNVTFSGNISKDGTSGALYIAAGGTVVMHGDVVLSTSSDTIANYGSLVWSIGLTDNGYISNYSLLNNTKYGSLVIANTPKSTYGKYKLADNAKSAVGTEFLLSDGKSGSLTVNSEEWVSCGNMEARVYVDANKKYSLWFEVRATRIDVNLETYTMQDDYVVDMTGSQSYEGDGGLIYVHNNGRLQNSGTVKITGAYATGDGGAVYSEGNIQLSHAKFLENHSYNCGGAIFGKGIKITLTDSVFSGNSADEGGAIWNKGGKTILDNVTFNNNTAIGDGGAIYGGDIELTGKVYLNTEKDTIWLEDGRTLNWTIDGNDNGYLSDYALIIGNVDETTFTIDAFNAMVGHCYILAGNAGSSAVAGEEQTFTITVANADGKQECHAMKVGAESLTVNDICYVLNVNEDGNLSLSVNKHIIVENDNILLIDSVQNFSWAGMGTYSGNGSIFEIQTGGVMTNIVSDGENTYSYAATFTDGSVTGNGGMICNAGILDLDIAVFNGNTAEGDGGAVYSSGQLVASESTFLNNKGTNGGAVYIAAGTDNYLSGEFGNNIASGKGGAVYLASGAALELGDVTFKGNESGEGGAVYSEGDILLTGELVLYSADDSFINKGSVTLDCASGASIRGYQYLANKDDGKLCISLAGLEAGAELWHYEFARGDFSGDYEYEDEFILTDGTSRKTITVGGGEVELNGLTCFVEINETGDALVLNAYAPKTLSIKLNDMEKMYDGIEMTCTDYTITGTLESTDDLIFTVSDSITDAGSKQIEINSWKILRNGTDVSYEYNVTTAGCTLKVNPREVTLTSGSGAKEYDGTALTSDTITLSGDGFAQDEGVSCIVTGSQTEVGTSKNTFTYELTGGAKEQNYIVTTVYGELAVTACGILTVVADSVSKVYDGQELTGGYSFNEGVLLAGDELVVTVEGAITDAGTAVNKITSCKVMRGDTDITGSYHINTVNGVLAVEKRSVTLTSASDSKTYDGTELTNNTVTVSGDGFVNGDGATYSVTGNRTEVGAGKNVFTYELTSGTKAENYDIKQISGNLVVLQQPESLQVESDKTILVNQDYSTLIVYEDVTLTIGATVTVKNLVINGGYVVNLATLLTTKELVVCGNESGIEGNVCGINAISFADGNTDLSVNKKQYDSMIINTDFTSTLGKLIVQPAVDCSLTENDIRLLIAKKNLSNVEFKQDLTGINKLLFATPKKMNVAFQNAYGTCKGDKILFGNNSAITFGQTGYVIDLKDGSNTIQIDKNAATTIKSDLVNVSTVKSASGSTVTLADIDFQLGRSATLKAEGISFTAGNVNGSEDKATSITTATGTTFKAGNFDFGYNNDKISVGKAGSFSAAEVKFNAGNDSFNIGQYADADIAGVIDLGSGNDTLKLENYGNLKSGSIVSAETVSFGAYSKVQAGNIEGMKKLTVSNGSAANGGAAIIADEVTGTAAGDSFNLGNYNEVDFASLDFGGGNDTLKLGNYGNLKSGSIVSAETVSFGAYSKVQAGNIEGMKKLTVSNGSAANGGAVIIADEVTGTAAGDNFNFGNYNDAELTSLAFGDGNDTLTLGNYTDLDIAGLLDFGDGTNDKLSLGKGSILSVKELDVDSLDSLSMGKESLLVIADADSLAAAQEKWSKYAEQIVSKLA